MNDTQAENVALAVQRLAIVVRDEGPAAVDAAALDVFLAAGGDCTAALIIAAALIRVDEPLDAWWQDGPDQLALSVTVARTVAQRQRAQVHGARNGAAA